jgi:hypothetical protein
MAIEDAEKAFAKMMRVSVKHSRPVLRDLLMRHRAALDAGLDHRTLRDKDARRQRAMEQRAHAAVRGAGAAAGMPSAPELLFGDPLPASDRWGTSIAPHMGATIGPLHLHETLGYEGRPTVPQAVLTRGERVGPHGMIKAQLQTHALPCVSYTDLLANTLEASFGNMLVDYGTAVHAGVSIENIDEARTERDIRAEQQDGARQWPPRALRCGGTASDIADIVNALVASVECRLPEPSAARTGLGTAGIDMYWRMCIEQLERTDLKPEALKDFRALGVCAYVRQTSVLPELQRRALTVALACHACGDGALGGALEQLAGVLVRCCKV